MEVKLGVALNHNLNTCIETALAEIPALLLFRYFTEAVFSSFNLRCLSERIYLKQIKQRFWILV